MGIISNIFKTLSEKYNQSKKEKEEDFFQKIKTGLGNSMEEIAYTLNYVDNWNELLNLKGESYKEKKEFMDRNTIKPEYEDCQRCFIFLGVIFCIFDLIGIQEGIIILNALFDEIKDEIFLLATDTPRKYNFYEHLEIASYKTIPEIDVAMVTCTFGIMFLKKFGFYCTDLTFQLLSSIGFLGLFLMFDFHTDEELVENYTTTEIVVLATSYLLFSCFIGCVSTIALKEFWDLYAIFKKYDDEFEENYFNRFIANEKVLFYLFPSISAVLIILINRIIFYLFEKHKDIKSKWLLISILGIFVLCFVSSVLFHLCYAIPIKNKEKEINQKLEEEKINIKRKIEENKEGKMIGKIMSNLKKIKNNIDLRPNSNPKSENLLIIDDEEKIKEEELKSLRDTYKMEKFELTKVCTLFGYVYFQKQIGEKNSCIIYNYTGCCSWANQAIIQIDNIFVIIEFICQFCMVGHNSIVSERLLNNSFWDNFYYFIILIVFSVILGIIYARCYFESIKAREEYIEGSGKKCGRLGILLTPLYIFFCYSYVCSYISIKKEEILKNISEKDFETIFIAELIIFKCLDLQILSLFEFFDNPDICNSALLITLEKVLWMILEPIFNLIPNEDLIHIQFGVSYVFFAILLLFTLLFANFEKMKVENFVFRDF